MPNPKKKFIKSFAKLKELFLELNDEHGLTLRQLDIFNDAQAEIINYFNSIERQLEGPELSVELPWQDQKFIDTWNLWKKYKKEQHRFTYKPIGEQGALIDLVEMSGGDMENAIYIVNFCRKKTWQGLHLPNEMKQKQISPKNIEHKKDIFKRLTQNHEQPG